MRLFTVANPHHSISRRLVSNVILHVHLQKNLLIMPKNYVHHAALHEQRLAIRKKLDKFAPGNVKLYVLGSGSKGVPSSLYLFSDARSYLFNCGEGTQRLANEHKRKLSRLDNIFITYPSWKNIGGLPGLALTVQDVGLPDLFLHGPDELEEIFPATSRFVVLNHLSVKKADCSSLQNYEDNTMTVKYVPLTSNSLSSREVNQKLPTDQTESLPIVEDDTDYYWHERKVKNRRNASKSSEDVNALKRNSPTSLTPSQEPKKRKAFIPGSTSMAFVCQLRPRAGTLNASMCVELNVPIGPLLGQLKAGTDVTLEDGTVIKASDVRDPDDPGPVFIVVDCPTSSFIDALINEKAFEKHQSGAEKDDVAFLVVHFSPPKVMKDSRYEAWMKKFPPTTHHLVINESNKCAGSVAIHEVQYRLNLLDANVFPLLKDSTIPVETVETAEKNASPSDEGVSAKNQSPTNNSDTEESSRSISSTNGTNLNEIDSRQASESQVRGISESGHTSPIPGRTLLCCDLRPGKRIDSKHCLVLKPNDFITELLKVEGFSTAMNEYHSQLKNFPPDSSDYPKIIFLGTGSSIPNKVRNTSGVLIQSNAETYVILDCGEGTYGQMVRFFGEEESDRILSKLKAIYVSHLHADHHIGLFGLLQARRKAIPADQFSPVYLLAPHQIMAWLQMYHRDFEPILDDFEIIHNTAFSPENEGPPSDKEACLLNTLNLSQIKTTKVRHCPNAFGISLAHSAGWKITYSGDTMPCERLVDIGMDSDVLIHEATMEDDLAPEAVIKHHSTTSQAIEIGRRMKAKFTLLTHFSQRYAKLPHLSHNYDYVGIAFDNMQVRLGDLKKLPLMIPALQVMFTEHCEVMKLKLMKRHKKKEREIMEGRN